MNQTYPTYGYIPYNRPDLQMQQQKLAELEQQYPQFAAHQPTMPQIPQPYMAQPQVNPNMLKCRAVTSIDEAKASIIDLDGSVHVFTDLGNKKIYTKQINLDGTATLNTYVLEQPIPVKAEETPLYVKQDELETICSNFEHKIEELSEKFKKWEKSSKDKIGGKA